MLTDVSGAEVSDPVDIDEVLLILLDNLRVRVVRVDKVRRRDARTADEHLAAARAHALLVEVGVVVAALLPVAEPDARGLLRRADDARRVVGEELDARRRARLREAVALSGSTHSVSHAPRAHAVRGAAARGPAACAPGGRGMRSSSARTSESRARAAPSR